VSNVKIVCDRNMPFVRDAFETLGEVVVLNGRDISAADVRDADMLAVRSTTRVDGALLDGSCVKFVGTATIGTDHIDQAYLREQGIAWCYAPGCNANSVSEYITAALLCLADRHNVRLQGRTIGVIGVGNVGRLVVRKAAALGLRILPNDPPRERAGERGESGIPFVSLDCLLREADIVTLHVPLAADGVDATFHLAGRAFFGRMKPGAIFLNAARGSIVDTNAFIAAMDAGCIAHAVFDTWEGEPECRADAIQKVDIGTPHIAGHSFEGKVAGTAMVYDAACRFLGVQPAWSPEPLLPEPPVPEVFFNVSGRSRERVLHELVRQVYNIEADDAAFREAMREPNRAGGFDRLRKHYPVRREFRFTRARLANGSADLFRTVAALGFAV
jgi:erythronate-4-phosphate dehydrogenase